MMLEPFFKNPVVFKEIFAEPMIFYSGKDRFGSVFIDLNS